MPGLPEVGVKAVVQGLAAFSGDMKRIDKTIRGLVPGANLVHSAFKKIGDFFTGIFHSAVRIVEYALGNLLAGAIRNVIQVVKDLISSIFDAGKMFQTLSIRLDRLNFSEINTDIGDFDEAMQLATEATKEQMVWLQRLAVLSPYDFEDVALVYTMGRAYGFTNEQTKRLTQNVADFSAGMGLTVDHARRIIYNLGQMQAAGKVTGRDLRDLATSFVPVNDILTKMRENTGLAGAEFDEFRNSAEGVEMFLDEFSKLVETNYVGAAAQLARTFEFAIQNVKDFFQAIGGYQVVMPVLDKLGAKIADIVDAFTEGGRMEFFQTVFGRIGESISNIVGRLLDMTGTADELFVSVGNSLLGIAQWLEDNEDAIVEWFEGIGETIKNDVIPWIRDVLIPKIGEFIDFLTGNKDAGEELFGGIADVIVNQVVPAITEKILPSIQTLIQFILDNEGPILEFAKGLGDAFSDIGTIMQDYVLPWMVGFIDFLVKNEDSIRVWTENIAKAAFFIGTLGFWLKIFVVSAIAGFIHLVSATGEQIGEWLGIVSDNFNEGAAIISASLGWAGDSLLELGKNIGEWVIDTGKKFYSWVTERKTNFTNWKKDTGKKIDTWATETGESIETWATETGTSIGEWVTNSIESIGNWAEETGEAIVNWVTDMVAKMGDFATEMEAKGAAAAQKFKDKLIEGLWKIVEPLAEVINAILAIIGPLLNLSISISLPDIPNIPIPNIPTPDPICFMAGTSIAVPGEKPIRIEEVEVGQEVWCWDGGSGLRKTTVTQAIVHESEEREVWHVRLENGVLLRITPNHPVLSKGGWIEMGELEEGETLTSWSMQEVAIQEITKLFLNVPVYNLHVEDEEHNYIADGLIVHNKDVEALGIPAPVPVVNNVTNNFGLNINSNARTEDVVADFEMMRGLVI